MNVIDANGAIQIVQKVDEAFVKYVENSDDLQLYSDVRSAVLYAPTIEAEPVRYGRWERIDYDESYCECSKCKTTWEWGFVQHCKMNYCPNCGAKMGAKEAQNGTE